MKKKLINALKTLYHDKGFNQTELEELADIVGQNLTEDSTEDDINNAASGASVYVGFMQKFGNRCASAVENKYKGYIKPEPKQPEPKKPEGTLTKEQVEEMLKTGIADALKPYKEAEQNKRLAGILSAHSKLKNIPSKFVGRYKLEKEEDADNLASQIEQDYAEERKEILSSLGISDVPPLGNGSADSDDDFLKKMQSAQKALAPKSE
jgi:hypothetical protein|nr:MAG TPA: hypothetical protein [Caudoviricetes sp.]